MNDTASQPFWINETSGDLFAWHHRPSRDAREAAVLLCKPFGHEAACTHRAYRHLAMRLAKAGFHVVRLDYAGTGDSSGGDEDGERLSAWLESVRAGVGWIRARLGVSRVVLFGARFGALMALATATGQAEVDGLVLVAPPASARAWLREGRALQSLLDGDGRKRVSAPGGAEEIAGFLFARATVDALVGMDPLAGSRVPPAVLLVARDDLPGGEDRLAAKLESRGSAVTLSKTPGYGAMMHYDPHRAVVPDAIWAEIVNWLTARYGISPISEPATKYAQSAIVRENQQAPPVREEAVDMGGLFGIISEPVEAGKAHDLPAVVLHNIGANPHFGTNRLCVGIARRLSAVGFSVLRFDSTGLGDSPATNLVEENRVYSTTAVADSRRAMDFLGRARGLNRFVLVGLCSGAYVSFHTAVADVRVVSIVLMNILLFHWKEGDPIDVRKRDAVKSTRFYSQAALDRKSWVRLLHGDVHLKAIVQGLMQKAWERARSRVRRALAGESDICRGLRSMMHRGVDVLLVFAGEDGGRDVIDEHLGVDGKRLRNEARFRIEIIDGTDHTFSPLWSRELLFSLLTSHLLKRFASTRSRSANVREEYEPPAAAAPRERV
ncbi:MAG: alpha/beta fold hydrolase [Myxococcota bacterium]|nr:alpha/beta fold hydrolase [Myxococcota bacterium]